MYEPALDTDSFYRSRVIQDLTEFKAISDVIVTNRRTTALEDVDAKLYSRDLFGSD